jgi:hypothetical protein
MGVVVGQTGIKVSGNFGKKWYSFASIWNA